MKIRKPVLILSKFLVSSGLLYIVVSKAGLGKVISTLSRINILFFLLAVFIYIFSVYISAIRWRLLLPGGAETGRLFSLYLIGSFFNNFLPGTIGGDALKAYYLSIELKNNPQPEDPLHNAPHPAPVVAIASVFMDRYIGFTALMSVGLIASVFGLRYLRGSYIEWVLPSIVMLFIIGSFLVFGLRIGRKIRLLSGLYEYFKLYTKQKAVIAKAFSISVFIQILGAFAVYILCIGLKIHVPMVLLFIFIPITSAITTIPISISGVGLREASFVLLFGFMGLSPIQATTISFAWFLSMTIGSLAGLIEYLRYKRTVDSLSSPKI